ncbi:MAG: hypothetical protein P8Y36_08230 [Alphaproteobacteria bacterium]
MDFAGGGIIVVFDAIEIRRHRDKPRRLEKTTDADGWFLAGDAGRRGGAPLDNEAPYIYITAA